MPKTNETISGSSAERPSMAHLKCAKCKEWKHRQLFVPYKVEKLVKYDRFCSKCRGTVLNYEATKMNLVVLHNRVKHGLTTKEKQEEILRKKQASRDAVMPKVRKAYYEKRNADSWDKPHASANIALKLLRAFPFPDEECKQWGLKAEDMVLEALEEIKERKKKEKLPDSQVLFWYDVVVGMGHALRGHIADYPLGPEKAPIQCI